MDTDSGPSLRPGGTVEPANRAKVARDGAMVVRALERLTDSLRG